MDSLQILLLDDEQTFRTEISNFFKDLGHACYPTDSPVKAFELLNRQEFDIAIVDIVLPDISGIEVIKKINAEHPNVECIAITGYGDMQTAIDAFRAGAVDFFAKPFKLFDVKASIERTARYHDLLLKLQQTEINYKLASQVLKKTNGLEIAGTSKAMKRVISLATKVASTDSTSVLITGESGTGKELIARGIHALSERSKHLFHSVNCAAIPETLYDSEFFGHNKGAFTGAVENTSGWFELSHHGTLFLDEVAELPVSVQAKFLRVLDDKIVSRVGGKKEINLDLRVIAATNQDLEHMVKKNKFRMDLFHRLSTFVIHIPPLRERREDIPELINYYVKENQTELKKKIIRVDDSVYNKLYYYHFPGNVRELKNIIEQAMIICDEPVLHAKHLCCFSENQHSSRRIVTAASADLNLDAVEKRIIEEALEATGYNKKQTSQLLDVSRQTLDRKIKKHGIQKAELLT